MNKKKWLSSSSDPTQISTTIKGGVLACSVLILAVAKMLGIPFTEADVVTVGTQLGAVVSGMIILYGLVKKVIVSFGTEK